VGANSSAPSDSPGLLNLYTTPPVAYEIMSEPYLLYVHILFGLKVMYGFFVRECLFLPLTSLFVAQRTNIWGAWKPIL
jgi:hypothetical protein